MNTATNVRILVIDDNESIHRDFRRILTVASSESIDDMERDLFGDIESSPISIRHKPLPEFDVDSTFQGEDGLRLVVEARAANRPYSVVFVDVRMPPGIDGVTTLAHIFAADKEIQGVLCTAYSDVSWVEIMDRLTDVARFVILKKPFESVEVRQLATALGTKWLHERASLADRRELVRAKEAAEAGTRAKSQFLANMSHEIRTPLNGVIGMTGVLLDTPLSVNQREIVETIRTSGDVLLRILNDVLDFSKIEAKQLVLDAEPFDVRACIDEAVEMTTHHAMGKGLEFVVYVHPDVPRLIRGDAMRLRQILVNLLNNAVKFTAEGEVFLEVALQGRTSSGSRCKLQFHVRDTGIGISAEGIERLFRSFSQVDGSITRRFGGSGLGLVISRELVELMGGQIEVESRVGGGSTFQFNKDLELPVQPGLHYALQETMPLIQRQALVVAGNATLRHALTLELRSLGMVPLGASSEAEAQTILRTHPNLSVVVVDAKLADGDGVEFAGKLVADASRKAISTLLLVPPADAALPIRAERLGITGCIRKPLKTGTLFDSVLKAISRGSSAPAQPARTEIDATLATRLPFRILLAEDNRINQRVILTLLKAMGYKPDMVENGVAVLEALERTSYEIILMDIQMPEMDGIEATRRLRAQTDRGVRPYIIALTANAMDEDRRTSLEAGMDDFLTKPVRIPEIAAALQRAASSVLLRPQ